MASTSTPKGYAPGGARAGSQGSTDEPGTLSLEDIGRAKEVGQTVLAGFGAVRDKLDVERQARLDRGLDSLEAVGRAYAREEALADAQAQELLDDVTGAVGLFFEAVFEPQEFRRKHGLGGGGDGG